MVNAGTSRLRSRRIEDCDFDSVAALLARGFGGRRKPSFWAGVFERLRGREVPAELPKYGYMLETNGTAVGAILQIFSQPKAGNGTARCCVSSWYVEPEFRGYAPLLSAQALKHKNVTYLNISSAPHTRRIAEMQGYSRYVDGIFVAVPLFSRAPAVRPVVQDARTDPAAPFEAEERALLAEHAGFGCVSLWCSTPERAYPFVFRPRLVKGFIPCAQLIYCRDIADAVRFARPLGAQLAKRGLPFLVIDANQPVPGLVGKFFDGVMPKFFKGPERPRIGDLAYTETALFGL
jgi:hypothetical protein